jgi:hypothetical protein
VDYTQPAYKSMQAAHPSMPVAGYSLIGDAMEIGWLYWF